MPPSFQSNMTACFLTPLFHPTPVNLPSFLLHQTPKCLPSFFIHPTPIPAFFLTTYHFKIQSVCFLFFSNQLECRLSLSLYTTPLYLASLPCRSYFPAFYLILLCFLVQPILMPAFFLSSILIHCACLLSYSHYNACLLSYSLLYSKMPAFFHNPFFSELPACFSYSIQPHYSFFRTPSFSNCLLNPCFSKLPACLRSHSMLLQIACLLCYSIQLQYVCLLSFSILLKIGCLLSFSFFLLQYACLLSYSLPLQYACLHFYSIPFHTTTASIFSPSPHATTIPTCFFLRFPFQDSILLQLI
jgi:hypothetical protein